MALISKLIFKIERFRIQHIESTNCNPNQSIFQTKFAKEQTTQRGINNQQIIFRIKNKEYRIKNIEGSTFKPKRYSIKTQKKRISRKARKEKNTQRIILNEITKT